MIQLKDFSIGFHERILLDKVSTDFLSAGLTALIGRNGSGKSTLLKAICGLNDNYSGEILIEGENLRKISKQKLAHTIAYVNTQRPRMANLKCFDVVALGRSPYTGWNGRLSAQDREIVGKALETVKMTDYQSSYFSSLSDGESQKVMIARALAQDTPCIVLDEPTSFLDLPARYELVSLLKELVETQSKTILYSTHELNIALKLCDEIALIDSPTLINLPASQMLERLSSLNHPFSLFL
ncbi:MAG: ABC transporter ATP-binding protein [Muribaculaceae bacterium]|nr:ABC transporter ATP-binding protein [Muribaculaceae bacterium]